MHSAARLYMNYEDKDLTTAIDLKTHKTVAKWQSSCGEDGPHALSIDQETGHLFVACSTRAEILDMGHNGTKLSSLSTPARAWMISTSRQPLTCCM